MRSNGLSEECGISWCSRLLIRVAVVGDRGLSHFRPSSFRRLDIPPGAALQTALCRQIHATTQLAPLVSSETAVCVAGGSHIFG